MLTAPAAPAEAAACAAQPPGENGQSAGAAAFDPTAQAAPAPDALPVAPPLPGANVAVRTRPKAVTSGDAGGDTQAQDESAVPAAAAHAALLTSDAASVLAGQLVQSPVPVPPVGDPASSTGTTPASGQAPGSPVDPVVRQADLAASPWATSRAALRGQGPAAMLTQVDAAGATAVPAESGDSDRPERAGHPGPARQFGSTRGIRCGRDPPRTFAVPANGTLVEPLQSARQAARMMLAAAIAGDGASQANTPTTPAPTQASDSTGAQATSAPPSPVGMVGAVPRVSSAPASASATSPAVSADPVPPTLPTRQPSAGDGGAEQRAPRGDGPEDQTGLAAGKSSTPTFSPVMAAPSSALPTDAFRAADVSAPATPLGSTAGTGPALTDQVVRAVSLAWRGEIGDAQIRLTPEHLGEVSVSLHVEKGQVTAQVQATTSTARDWIQAHEQDLRSGLAAQGLQLDRLVVTADGQRQGQQDGEQPKQRRPSPARAPDASAPQFQVDA